MTTTLTTIYVECTEYDTFIAGTAADVEWLTYPDSFGRVGRLLVTTDTLDALMRRFDADDNVLSYEVCHDNH